MGQQVVAMAGAPPPLPYGNETLKICISFPPKVHSVGDTASPSVILTKSLSLLELKMLLKAWLDLLTISPFTVILSVSVSASVALRVAMESAALNFVNATLNWEIDELCDEWVPESLIPPITEEMQSEPPVLESFLKANSVSLGCLRSVTVGLPGYNNVGASTVAPLKRSGTTLARVDAGGILSSSSDATLEPEKQQKKIAEGYLLADIFHLTDFEEGCFVHYLGMGWACISARSTSKS
ncbi:hypothetical protein V6N13_078323 [Hibiscus sabdariffa]